MVEKKRKCGKKGQFAISFPGPVYDNKKRERSFDY